MAKSLFMNKGITQVSVRDIAEKAGINIAALNYHFKSKESLFEMIFDHVMSTAVPALQEILDAEMPIEDKIRRYIHAYFGMLVKNPRLPYFVISVLNNDPSKINRLKAFNSLDYTEKFARQLREEGERGHIRKVDPNHFFINLQSLINFPFIFQEPMREKNIMDDKDLVKFYMERKQVVIDTLLTSLQPDAKSQLADLKPRMYIHAIGHYFPDEKIDNAYYSQTTGLAEEDILKKTGIKERRKAGPAENANTMALDAVQRMMKSLDFPITDIDLIVSASYTPWDTIATPSHEIQRKYGIKNARALMISTACSSFVTAVEVVESYFATGKAHRALVVVSEHNTAYNDDNNPQSGFLWGDGAAAMVITSEKLSEDDMTVVDLFTQGLADISKGPGGVYCQPIAKRIQMPEGKDVFVNATTYITRHTRELLERNNYTAEDLDYLIPHQANMRIITKVGKDLPIKTNKVITNIEYLGNTGCAGAAIGLSEHWNRYRKDELIAIAVFGGGYSSGVMLLKK